jgi:diguanylate cyclase (GGDEF)-like protein
VTIVRRAQRLLYLAARDRLTGLCNRGHFDRTLATAMGGHHPGPAPLSLAILDVDPLQADQRLYGHALGDRALIEVANLLSRRVAPTWLPAAAKSS